MPRKRCAYDTDGRSASTARFCSRCGVMVNRAIRPKHCPTEGHAEMRRARSTYCVDCGERLAVGS